MKTTFNRSRYRSERSYLSKVSSQHHPIAGRTVEILQRTAEKLSFRSKWLGLVLFCLLSVGCSLGVIMYSVRTHHPFFSVEPIRLPVTLTTPNLLPGSKDNPVSIAHYKRIQAIESLLTRQKNHHSTKTFYDSLLKERTNFLDSLKAIDSLFLSQ